MKGLKQIKTGTSKNTKTNQKRIGERIRYIRANLSQTEFGDLVGAHRNTVRTWEEGATTPNNKILINFMELLNVDLTWLFSGKGEPFLDSQEQKGEPVAEPGKSNTRIALINRVGAGSRRQVG